MLGLAQRPCGGCSFGETPSSWKGLEEIPGFPRSPLASRTQPVLDGGHSPPPGFLFILPTYRLRLQALVRSLICGT